MAQGMRMQILPKLTCVAFFDRPRKPQCDQPQARRDGLCAAHGAEWDRITNDQWRVRLDT